MVAIGKTCQQEDLSSVQLSFFSTGKGGRPLFRRQDAIFYMIFKYHLEGFLNLAKEEALLVRTPNQSRPELIVPRWRRASHRDSFTPGPCLCSGWDSGDLNKIKKSFEFKQHSRSPLTLGHLWQLPKQLRSSSILSNFEPRWEKVKRERGGREENKDSGVSLLPALARTFSGQLLMVAALELLTLFCWQVTGINITKVESKPIYFCRQVSPVVMMRMIRLAASR